MRMPVTEFWGLSTKEWACALEGFIEFNSPSSGGFEPWSEDEIDEFEAFKRKMALKERLANGD